MIPRKRVWRALAVLVLTMLIAACGSGDDAGDTTTTAETDTTAAAPDTTEAPTGTTEAPTETTEAMDDMTALVEAAQEEGTLTLYGVPAEPVQQTLAEEFNAEYGITVEFVRLVSSDLQQRLAAEADSGATVADVILLTHSPFYAEGLENGWLIPTADAGVPNFPGDYPADYVVNDGAFGVVSVVPTSIVYNTDLVDTPPTDWTDYADPAYADGLLQIANPGTSPANLAFWKMLREEYGDEFLENVGANEPVWHDSAVPATQAVAAGEGALGFPGVDAIISNLQGEGAPIEAAQPELTSGPMIAVGVTGEAPHPNAGALFAAWLLSQDGSELLAEASGAGSPYGLGLPADFRAPVIPDEEESQEILDLLGAP